MMDIMQRLTTLLLKNSSFFKMPFSAFAWKNPHYNSSLAHHRVDGFCNPTAIEHESGDLDKWRKERRALGLPKPPKNGYAAFIKQWWQKAEIVNNKNNKNNKHDKNNKNSKINGSKVNDDDEEEEDGVWWLGHASLLLRIDGRYILTDPMFSNRASPLSFYGPVRKTPPPITVAELPSNVQALVISHNHYDHLDLKTVRQLLARFPAITVYVPLGLGPWFRSRGAKSIVELDWWDSSDSLGINVIAVPAQHWSWRNIWDRNRSLWCGWVFEGKRTRFWFSGDTAYVPDLVAITQRLGKFDAIAIPAGAYSPRWFMSPHHMDPQDAVKLWTEFGCPLAIPIHWGVFELADESLDDPVHELRLALADSTGTTKDKKNKNDNFKILKIGQYLSLTTNITTNAPTSTPIPTSPPLTKTTSGTTKTPSTAESSPETASNLLDQ